MSDEIKTFHVVVKGSVQGVGFRATIKRYADKLALTGSVKNLSNGSVEVYVQGRGGALDEFVNLIKDSKGLAKIEHVNVDDYSSSREYPEFEIMF